MVGPGPLIFGPLISQNAGWGLKVPRGQRSGLGKYMNIMHLSVWTLKAGDSETQEAQREGLCVPAWCQGGRGAGSHPLISEGRV